MLNRDPELGKNFWLALSLSMLIVFGYPLFLRWMNPQPTTTEEIPQSEEIASETRSAIERIKTVQPKELPEAQLDPYQPPEVIKIETANYSLEFSTLGGTITRLYYKGEGRGNAHTETSFFEAPEINPGAFGLRFLHDSADLTQAIFKASKLSGGTQGVEFVYEKANEYRIRKAYLAEPGKPVLHLDVTIENLSGRQRHFPVEILYKMDVDSTDNMYEQHHEAVVAAEKIESANLGKLKKKGFDVSSDIRWAGLIKKYFALLIKPDWKVLDQNAYADSETMRAELVMEPITLLPDEGTKRRLLIYAGPQRYETLKEFGYGSQDILSKGFFGMFKIWLLLSLKFLNRFTHNYGFAIILLTLLIKGIFAPLTHMSYKSMKKMQVIQPKIKALQERYKNDAEKLNKEMMELFKRNKVNPMAGCLPMLIQMPVLFAMFRLLPEAIELKDAPFIFWIQDLSSPDQLFQLPFSIPLLGWSALNLLPILMIFSQFGYQKLMPQTGSSPEMAKIMNFMPLFFGFICYNMPSGLVLYWFIQNLLSIIQQVFINRVVIALHHQDQD